uniref:RPOL4c domain-containing protein n=1 Tax=Caenorhabditis tropicalis TaxID=1561998 RepID=A0A1I7TGT6_9PELO
MGDAKVEPAEGRVINDGNVMEILNEAKLRGDEQEMKRCEAFLCFHSKMSTTTKLNLATAFNLEQLTNHICRPEHSNQASMDAPQFQSRLQKIADDTSNFYLSKIYADITPSEPPINNKK